MSFILPGIKNNRADLIRANLEKTWECIDSSSSQLIMRAFYMCYHDLEEGPIDVEYLIFTDMP